MEWYETYFDVALRKALTGSQSQVVGIPDQSLGESPIAIVQSLQSASKDKLKQSVLDTMGSDYAIGHVFTLDELGMSTWPVNETGKIMKITLQQAVIRALSHGSTH